MQGLTWLGLLCGHAEIGASGIALYRQGTIMLLELVSLNKEGRVNELTSPNLYPKQYQFLHDPWQRP